MRARRRGIHSRQQVKIDGRSRTLEQLGGVARGSETCTLAGAARRRVEAGRAAVEKALGHGDVVYGVNTGFGALASVRIPPVRLLLLRERLVLSDAAGMGEPLPDVVVRAMLLLRA